MGTETIADIVKSLRDGSIYDENGCFDSHEIADRIEAAYRAEFDWLVVRENKWGDRWCDGRFDTNAEAEERVKITAARNAEMGHKTYVKKVMKGEKLWSR